MKIVGIGEYAISSEKEDIIKTFSLGSCVAITVYCPKRKASGLAHIALPSTISEQASIDRPAHFADRAIPLMLDKFCYTYGCSTNDLQIGIFGGALSSRENDSFKIGLRNVQTIKSILSNRGIPIYMDDTGGYCSRTVEVDVETGKITIDTRPMII